MELKEKPIPGFEKTAKHSEYKRIFNNIIYKIRKQKKYEDFLAVYELAYNLVQAKTEIPLAVEYLKILSLAIVAWFKWVGRYKQSEYVSRFYELHFKVLVMIAPYDFESYLLAMEWDRPNNNKFYPPRRKQLAPVVEALQELADDKIELLCISLPPGTGKTTLALFYITWLAGRNDDLPILTGSHSNSFISETYKECLRLMDANGEYKWTQIFGKQVNETNAKDQRINIGKPKRFQTLQFTSIGSGNAGLYRAMQLLYCDDLVNGIETALSKDQLDKLWNIYVTDFRQRKLGDKCKELHIATRWSVYDVVGRLETENANNDRAKFINIPALNKFGKSNFDYPRGLGYTTKDLLDQCRIMGGKDDPSWRALYMGEPIEREGILYHADELRRFFDLPEGQPDAIIGVCDTKDKGTDYCVHPVGYVFGEDHYILDTICDNSLPEILDIRLRDISLKHKIHSVRYESNSAGGRTGRDVQKLIDEKGGRTKIQTKYTTLNKETKIVVNSAWVKEHCLFLDESKYKPNSDYGLFMKFLCSWTLSGKNKHDDVPDAMAMYAEFAQSLTGAKIEVFRRPF